MRRLFIWLSITAAIVISDQVLKHYFISTLTPGTPIVVTPYFHFNLAFNTGAAFSFLAKGDGWQRWLLAGVALVASALLTRWAYQLKPHQKWLGFSYALILGGALGNLIDRLLHGYVIDYISVFIFGYAFPIFNLADIAINVGAAMFIIDLIFWQKPKEQTT